MKYKYKAFISYRHRETDQFVASKLQKLLEGFRIKGMEPWKLFRDDAELPTSSSLSDDIENALKESEYLIVICTPALNESRWCMREITTFKALHGGSTDRILPVLVEGEPDEVFPQQLKTTVKQIKNPVTGEDEEREVEIEPLAANVCSSTRNEINKKLKVEYLRLAAAMSGVGFDDLYNRKRRQQIKRISLMSGIVVLAAVAFGIYNFSVNLKLEEKNLQISDQLQKTLMANAEALNGQAEALYDNGRVRDAIETLLSAYELNDDNTSIIPASDRILASEIGAFSTENILPCVRLPHLIEVQDFYFRNDGHRLVTVDSKGNIYLWNADNGELVKQWKSVANGLERVTCLIGDDHSVDSELKLKYLFNGMVHGYTNEAAGMVMEGFRPFDAASEIPKEDDSFILYSVKRMWIVDSITGEETQIRIEDIADDEYLFADWGDHIVAFSPVQREDNVIVLSPKDGSIIRKMTVNAEKLGVSRVLTDHYVLTASMTGRDIMALSDKNDDAYQDFSMENEEMNSVMSVGLCQTGPYLVDIERGITGENIIDFDTVRFVVYDKDGQKLWTFSDSLYDEHIMEARYIPADENDLRVDLLLLVYGNRAKLCDAATGEVLEKTGFEETVLDYRLGSTGILEVTLCNGKVIRHSIGSPYTKLAADTEAKPKQMKVCADKVAVVTENGAQNVDIYIRKENADSDILGNAAEITGDEKASVSKVIPSQDAKVIYYKTEESGLIAYSVETKESRLLYTHDQFIDAVYELKHAIGIADYKSITLIDKKDGSVLSDHLAARMYCYIPEKQELAFWDNSIDNLDNAGREIRFTDGKNESVYQVENAPSGKIENVYCSEDGRCFAIVYEIDKKIADGYRTMHSILLCDRDDETATHLIEMQYKEPYVFNVRFSSDDQRCIVSLNTQSMSEKEGVAPGIIEVFDCTSGKQLYSHETDRGMIIDEFVHEGDTYLLCADYTVEVLGEDGQLTHCIVLDEKDRYRDLDEVRKEFYFAVLNERELLIYNVNRGFVVDTEKNTLRLLVEDETYAGSIRGFFRNENRILIATPWQVSTYPIYSSNELYQKAAGLLKQ